MPEHGFCMQILFIWRTAAQEHAGKAPDCSVKLCELWACRAVSQRFGRRLC